jgi:hypothetical protein
MNPRSRDLPKQIITQLVKKFPRHLCNPMVYYRVYRSLPLVPILCHMHLVHTLPPCFFSIYFNIILPFMPRSSNWHLPFMVSNEVVNESSSGKKRKGSCYDLFPVRVKLVKSLCLTKHHPMKTYTSIKHYATNS